LRAVGRFGLLAGVGGCLVELLGEPLALGSRDVEETRIELALSAWESVQSGLLSGPTCAASCP
jgi:hypothetical protein